MTGFSDLPLPEAQALIDSSVETLAAETIGLDEAAGRTLRAPFISQADWPNVDCAAKDGYAIRAGDSEGAGEYNPVLLPLLPETGETLPPGAATVVTCGTALPSGADAVMAFEAAQRSSAAMLEVLEVLAPVARGAGVDRRGSELRAGEVALSGPRRLRPQDLALLAAFGVAGVTVT
ncbi:MAG: molybdopterin molybdenumtransferase MoeA, partial [Pseudomonadota bacterium]|nr:molybdopterin molybdenumtransferase MoeA [Pseudomonadota bacterium]